MRRVLITGPTGNVGSAVIDSLNKLNCDCEIVAGLRDLTKGEATFSAGKLSYVQFDFEDVCSFKVALSSCDTLFLLRPPQLANVEKIFKPLLDSAKSSGVTHIVFLSVQGVERSRVIPHNKIERLIVDSGISFTFLRPAYFMQNFSTTLKDDIHNRELYLPSSDTPFALIDVRDIGDVAAIVLANPRKYVGEKIELTCQKRLNFAQMAESLSQIMGVLITYKSPNLFSFFVHKRREGVAISFILVLIMLHFLPRFQRLPVITNSVQEITGHMPREFDDYIRDNRELLLFL
jgi:uncharacterized protein YbjT (DUF2867 family)